MTTLKGLPLFTFVVFASTSSWGGESVGRQAIRLAMLCRFPTDKQPTRLSKVAIKDGVMVQESIKRAIEERLLLAPCFYENATIKEWFHASDIRRVYDLRTGDNNEEIIYVSNLDSSVVAYKSRYSIKMRVEFTSTAIVRVELDVSGGAPRTAFELPLFSAMRQVWHLKNEPKLETGPDDLHYSVVTEELRFKQSKCNAVLIFDSNDDPRLSSEQLSVVSTNGH